MNGFEFKIDVTYKDEDGETELLNGKITRNGGTWFFFEHHGVKFTLDKVNMTLEASNTTHEYDVIKYEVRRI